MKKKSIFLDDSILFFLLFPNKQKEKIYYRLTEWIKDNYNLISSTYSLLKIKEIFLENNKLEIFFEFYKDISKIIEVFLPVENTEIEKTWIFIEKYQMDFDLAYYFSVIENHQIENFCTLRINNYKDDFIKKFSINFLNI